VPAVPLPPLQFFSQSLRSAEGSSVLVSQLEWRDNPLTQSLQGVHGKAVTTDKEGAKPQGQRLGNRSEGKNGARIVKFFRISIIDKFGI